MELICRLFAMPDQVEACLLLGYVAALVAGARVLEAMARRHLLRAQRLALSGFEYDADADHYECPQGERLALHLIETQTQVAIYKAPASVCRGCSRKALCTPHDEGRHLYRSLAAWAETDVGRFHQRLSLLMFGVAAVLSVGSLIRWWAQPGTGWLMIALAASIASLAQKAVAFRRNADRQGQSYSTLAA